MGKNIFGVDLGGTSIKMGLFAEDGTLADEWEIPTRTEDHGAGILPDIAENLRGAAARHGLAFGSGKDAVEGSGPKGSANPAADRIAGIGIGVPGPVDANGIVHTCPNLGWGTFDVARALEDMTGLPVAAANDANAAALGEMWMGGGQGFSDMFMVTLGTGIGGSLILNGRIVHGFHGIAGEIGHICVNEDEEEACGCGKHGCLEQYASASGVARMARRYLAAHDEPTALREIPAEALTAKDVFDAAKNGDVAALALVDTFGHMLGRALASVSSVADPEVFVIGGGLSQAGEIVVDITRNYFREFVFSPARETPFRLATLGSRAGIYGAARLFLDEREPA